MCVPSFLRIALLPAADECGQDLIEYVLITALVVFILLIVLDQFTPGLGVWLQELFGRGGAGSVP